MFAKNLKYDLKAGFSVFLLALPLCLGIAMASNFPPIAGIITAIVGGIVSSFMGSSRLTIKGPAAGLIVIALGAVSELGGGDIALGYKRALAVGVVAAIIQILFSLFRLAKVAEIMPPSVIHGMLAAIGVIIIAKQSHVMLGVAPHGKGPLALLAEIPSSLSHLNPQVFMVGLLSFLIVVFWPKFKKLSVIPASIVVLAGAIPLSFAFDFAHAHSYSFMGHAFEIGPKFLIDLPGQILSALTFPDFSVITSATSAKYIIMFALVGSIESLLTVCAVDNLDPEKQKSDLNKDLFAVGVGNLISSFLGGLPMISEIVRTKANIDYEAKSKYSNFFHGCFLLFSIAALPWLLRSIPLSALAALLVFTGIRLASPAEFRKTYMIGWDQFTLFTTTLVVTLMSDLLIGVASGILLKLVFHLFRGATLRDFMVLDYEEFEEGDAIVIELKGSLVFSNYLKLKALVNAKTSEGKNVVLSLANVKMVDHTIQEKLEALKESPLFRITGLEELKAVSEHELAFKSVAG